MATQIALKTLLNRHTIDAAPELALNENNDAIRCLACGHRCLILENRSGVCKVRFNENGSLRVPAGYVAGLQVDPIEKKPFYHVFPGHKALSFGMLGCDYHCSYCQNWVTSQSLRDDRATAMPKFCDAESITNLAIQHQAPVVVSTYNEPLITAEWAVQVFSKAKQHNLLCGFVSNGNATPEVLEYLRPYVDLYKVDLKSFNDRAYRALGGVLDRVLDTIQRLKSMGFWVEIVTLVIPGFNDSDDELTRIADFIAGVSIDIPWHVTAFHPDYKMTDPPPTTPDQLIRAYDIGRRAGLQFVYPGNIPGAFSHREDTHCSHCDQLLIRRRGFTVLENHISNARCPSCQNPPPGIYPNS